MSKIFIITILIFIIIQKTKPQSQCNEQWTELLTSQNSNWYLINQVTQKDSDLTFYSDESNPNSIGIAWNEKPINSKSGIQISFIPNIIIDNNFYGNLKYQQGFSIIFTLSQISNDLIGKKGSGLGYDGINNAVAFEFDFIFNNDKNDIKNPHFSAHYNLNGPISSISPKDCIDYCNIILPNFYDSSKDKYMKNLKFYIEIVGGKIKFYNNRINDYNIKEVDFPFLDYLF